jgi:hypothetical protein
MSVRFGPYDRAAGLAVRGGRVFLEARRSLLQLREGVVRSPVAVLQEIFRNVHVLAGSGYSHRNDGAEAEPSTSSPTRG